MARQFKRRCVVLVQPPDPSNFIEALPDAVVVDGLRVKFSIQRSLEKTPNQATIQIFNLSPSRRGELQKKGTKVVLQAGHEDTVRQIFSGDSNRVENIQENADWVTKFECGDGERAYRFARFSETYAPGATVESIVRALAGAMNLDATDAVAQARAARGEFDQYVTGYAFHGRASDGLDEVLKSIGLTWSVQDGRLQVLRPQDPAAGEAVLLSPSSGLIGSPMFGTPKEKDGPSRLTAKCLLQPSLRCGGRVVIESRAVNGEFKIFDLTHTGDTHGGDWFSTMELEALG